MDRQFRPEFFTPKFQEALNDLHLNPGNEKDMDAIIATSMVLNDALWEVYDEINSTSGSSATTGQLNEEIEKRSGLKNVLEAHVRTTLEKLDGCVESVDMATMILVRKRPNYEIVSNLLKK